MKNHRILLIIIVTLVLASCGAAPAGQQNKKLAPVAQELPSTHVPDSISQGDTTEMDATTPTDPGLQDLIEKAKEDLAQRLNILITQISLIEAKAVVWPDASMGCPQPGMQYKQVPYDGAMIILQVEKNAYEYHNGGARGLFLCVKVYKELSPPPQIDIFNLTPSEPGSSTPDNNIPPGESQ